MTTWRPLSALLAASLLYVGTASAVDLADAPLFSTTSVPGNVALALSVEWPTATTPSYPSTTAYASGASFVGYFDPEKCYRYIYNAATPTSSYFAPNSAATNRTCTSTGSLPLWSGNYLNWASMQTLDIFRWALTGGYRTTDTASNTVITKTYADVTGGGSIAPDKSITTAVTGATPFNWVSATSSIKNRGISLLITGTNVILGTADSAPTSGCVTNVACLANNARTDYNAQNSYASAGSGNLAVPGTTYELFINVQVCKPSSGVTKEDNCVAYGDNYKPEGLMQKYSKKLRFAAFGYLNDSNKLRDGGVLRAPMRYLGPTKPVPGSSDITNPDAEWDGSTGVMLTNPDSALATSSTGAFGVTVSQSGAMNYLNKFGLTTAGGNRYKSYDPVSELYYTILRYFKNLGPVPEYASMSGATTANKTTWLDGFPVATSWSDPIIYACQKNFILAIGDVNTHRDANLPGTSLWTAAEEPATPALVTADTSVNVTTATAMVAKLEGLNASIATSYLSAGRADTYYVAGLAYDAHTVDMRSDLSGNQTINTYFVDVMEGQYYSHKSEYWLAAKYGGFTVPDGFRPYDSANSSTTLSTSAWNTNTTPVVPGYPRPDNYFGANQGSAMVDGLNAAFSKIVSEADSQVTTASSSATRKVSSSGNGSYAASYDPKNWTGNVTGSTATFNASGNVTLTDVWDGRALLDAMATTDRKIVTCCTSAGAALPFTTAAMDAASLHSRTLYSSFSTVPGVTGTQTAANYLSYLRGNRSMEQKNGGAYRNRNFRLGDIVGSKANPVAAPQFPYYDATNPGYSAFKTSYKNRTTVVYAGANDGMLHAFDGTVSGSSTTKGKELFAYIPSFTYGESSTSSDRYFGTYGLAALGNPGFSHHYYVNATPLAFDIDLGKTSGTSLAEGTWRTVLIGGLGKGGRGYYAIDVTDPTSWTSETAVAGKVMWEFTDSRMGYSYGEPHVVKTAKYGWVVLLASGYNNSDGKAYLFIVNPRTGALLEAVATTAGTTSAPLNMGNIRAYIPDLTDYTADAVYGADLAGNVWRFDLTATSGSYPAPVKLATLTNPSDNALSVTTKPLIGVDPTTQKRYVMVGTGRLLADSDISSSQTQAFIAIVDGTGSSGGFFTTATLPAGYSMPFGRADLSRVTDLTTGISGTASPVGWYHTFSVTSRIAERMNVDGDVSGSLAAFAVNLPNGDACSPAGTSRYFAVNFAKGKTSLLDSNGNALASVSNSSGVATEVNVQSVDGEVRVTVGDSSGQVKSLTVQQDLPSLRRLNWREISTVN
ncbi:MAG: pilus assembly protein [Burkholderiales bacterium PBB6]|nr:MAG: pilus assembly protein [Burkholderiales bacterium PBB6]